MPFDEVLLQTFAEESLADEERFPTEYLQECHAMLVAQSKSGKSFRRAARGIWTELKRRSKDADESSLP